MLKFIARKLKHYLKGIGRKLKKHPIKNTFILLFSLAAIYIIGQILFHFFGILTLVGYIFACLYDITAIIDKPKRTFVWALGYAVSAVMIGFFFGKLYPAISGKTAASVYSLAMTAIIIIILFLQSRKLKGY